MNDKFMQPLEVEDSAMCSVVRLRYTWLNFASLLSIVPLELYGMSNFYAIRWLDHWALSSVGDVGRDVSSTRVRVTGGRPKTPCGQNEVRKVEFKGMGDFREYREGM